jgi:D-lactate dehydrogenase
MFSPKYQDLYDKLLSFIPVSRVCHDPLRTLAYGTDASFYRLVPKLVIHVETEEEVSKILQLTQKKGIPVTFRAAGTSLSGQAITDSVLIKLGDGWRDYRISVDASKIHLQPGIIGGHANRYLAPFGKKIGPDPASIDAAMIGGIAANNASGMCCGTAQNSYNTLHSMKIIFGDGTVLNTSDAQSRRAFAQTHPHIPEQILNLARKVKENEKLANRIRHKFKIKNTTGYSLNALVDFDDPFEIIQHLMIGSEGTLGFMAEITYHTVEEHAHKATSLMLFRNIEEACQAATILREEPVNAVELMDRASLRSVEEKEGMPGYLKTLDENAAALLVETRADNESALDTQISWIPQALASIETVQPIAFTTKKEEFTQLWSIRKGLFPSVGAVRNAGTTVVIEDVAFPIHSLAQATLELQGLLKKYAYHEAIIFGHALEGNLHFVFTQDFNQQSEVERYQKLMDDVCHMVVHKYDGSLKGEHGTGRNMAPYVEMEWGKEAYELMREIKDIFDPENLLNPGVILNNDSEIHLKNLKPLPVADPIVDKCTECGFCESICPSKNLTSTPRQRIVSWREIARMQQTQANSEKIRELYRAYKYFGEETCAADGLCAIKCPISINTGELTKHMRSHQFSLQAQRHANWIADHFATVAGTMRKGLTYGDRIHRLVGSKVMENLAAGARLLSANRLPLWNRAMPAGATPPALLEVDPTHPLKVVYFPSCVSRTMGPGKDDPERDSLPQKTESLLRKAGYEIIYPPGMDGLCCGQPFESKGFFDQATKKAKELEQALLEASNNGEYPILCDTSPCLYQMKQTLDKRLQLYEPVEFIHKFLRSRLKFIQRVQTLAVHTPCSAKKMGLDEPLKQLAEACARKVIVPENIDCCGFAGDRGFTHPELNSSALKELKSVLPPDCKAGYSTSRTCEIGLSLHGGIPYRSIIYLVDECTER